MSDLEKLQFYANEKGFYLHTEDMGGWTNVCVLSGDKHVSVASIFDDGVFCIEAAKFQIDLLYEKKLRNP